MRIGPFVRQLCGPYERRISDAYRGIYLDMDAFVMQVHRWSAHAIKILEVGCGEGAVTTRLRTAYPTARITAIDISPRLGRLYSGSPHEVLFIQSNVQDVAATNPGDFDLVVLSDVLHHVPIAARKALLEAVKTAMAPHGTFVFKDWEKSRSPIHWLCYASDRWLTGDRVSYMSREEMHEMLKQCFGDAALFAEARIRPWRNNIATAIHR
jgi:2-polyprenyl-6-hydroxyphenyl methylase/3-demethylubiquinone-9 3-methyltransferase